ncbi:hypothetical protein CDD80_2580 [Ophiocordyceps camponoti-rufipedis]|uniref:BZIP domain-containing protein n=1 Tax=Ophiocordyceps camponoti-rufipedis TaxID=2004952 RepID=A0A2C5YAU8_9HYPO|nr:hypothetical protein CDD80_2580 [Ophiocordyceps camponoti-rufipedis]
MAKLPLYYAAENGNHGPEQQLVRQEQSQHQSQHHHQQQMENCDVDGAFFLNLNYHHHDGHVDAGQPPASAYAAAAYVHQQREQQGSSNNHHLQLPLRPLDHRSPSPSTGAVTSQPSVAGERSDSAPVADSSDPAPLPRRTRGRPRLETQDRNATDRRRTQIRLAQRQYRQRKEARMTALERKVKELSRLNDSMSTSFSHFYDALLAEHVFEAVPHAGQRLQALGDRLLALACACKNAGEDTNESQASEAEEEPLSAHPLGSGPGPFPYGDVGGGYPHPVHVQPSTMHPSSSLAYEMVTQPPADNNANFHMYASTEPYQVYCPSPCPTLQAASSSSSSSSLAPRQEGLTFGRRFQRASIEAGIRLVTMQHPPAERYAAVFGFGLFFEPRETINHRLRLLLRRAEQDVGLRCWRAPLANAEAGDHFLLASSQRLTTTSPACGESKVLNVSSNGNMKKMEGHGSREFEQQQETTMVDAPETEVMRGERFYRRVRMLLPGLEGELLDADEVDVYLGRLGVFVPQGAEVVEAELNVSDLNDAASVWSPLTADAGAPTPVTDTSSAVATQQQARTADDGNGLGSFTFAATHHYQPQHHSGNMSWAPVSPSASWCQAKVTINVNILMKGTLPPFPLDPQRAKKMIPC